MKSESDVQQLIQLEAPKHNCVLLRNNSGAFTDANGRLVRFGLGQTSNATNYKSSDLIGWTEITITSEMVGKKVAVFTAIEVKKEAWRSTKNTREALQENFINWVKMRGGIAAFINNVDDFIRLLRQ